MDKDKVLALAKLARLEISDSEAEGLSKEFEGILGYVAEVKNAVGATAHTTPVLALKNALRADEDAHESGLYTEAILNEAPEREGDYVKVKNIL